ncbi:glycosyltransferase family 10 domain-containing protein [Nostoc sp. TCL26-01]|uniref:glycosyltransferase family 10 domain-containing protein n=1 Tax=Nostoc sp. TCL26-01 TaxID=2576904 RepID=UPI0015BD8245|nr:glycosyltransferase family 10 [Nostoc sp. TCL26-01]QLE56562.1 glycosyltransferase [Nostoc sp. TCL26-01]
MTIKTVGMMSSYPNLDQRQDWMWQQTPHPFGIWGNMQIHCTHPKPDFLLMYNYTSFPKQPQKQPWWVNNQKAEKSYHQAIETIKTKLRGVPKERVIYLLREPPLTEIVEANKRFYREAEAYCGYISGPDDFAPQPDYMPAIWYVANSFRDLNDLPSPPKTRVCSWITSGIDRTANHRQRLDFLRLLRNHELDFDLYGRDLPDWANGKGQIGNKWYAIAPYYYNLAIENYADNSWYVSEKLWDALLAWCLPIYYGGPAADKLLPPGSFLRLPSLDEKGLAYIREVTATPDAWYEAKEAIAEARQIILHKLNLLEWLSNYTKNHT